RSAKHAQARAHRERGFGSAAWMLRITAAATGASSRPRARAPRSRGDDRRLGFSRWGFEHGQERAPPVIASLAEAVAAPLAVGREAVAHVGRAEVAAEGHVGAEELDEAV